MQLEIPLTLEEMIAHHNVLRTDDVKPAANFIRTCLQLEPNKRPSATDLLNHRWLDGASVCRDYRPAILPQSMNVMRQDSGMKDPKERKKK